MSNASQDPPKVAVIGAGYWGKNLVRNFANLDALGMVCDPDSGACANATKISPGVPICASFSEVLAHEEIEAVAIATPAVSHYQLAKAALAAGKDVFVEKPLALEAAEGQELVELAAKQGRILMVGHILHYHRAIQKLKELIDTGNWGRFNTFIPTVLISARFARKRISCGVSHRTIFPSFYCSWEKCPKK